MKQTKNFKEFTDGYLYRYDQFKRLTFEGEFSGGKKMEKELSILVMKVLNSKENIKMIKGMEREKNIIIMEN